MLRPAHCSLYILCSQEREREKFIPLFSFSLKHYDIISYELPGHFALEKKFKSCFYYDYNLHMYSIVKAKVYTVRGEIPLIDLYDPFQS